MRMQIRFIYVSFCMLLLVSINCANSKPIREYLELDNAEIKLLIGEKIYNQPGDGCWSCHGSKGIKIDVREIAKKSEDKNVADLRDRKTWTSYKISTLFDSKSMGSLSQKDISTSLIRLGAEEWNKNLAPAIRKHSASNIIFFDEQMIGIHSKMLKKNARSMSSLLKREKIKFKGRDVMDIMATSVFFYIEEKFIKNVQ